MIRERAQAELHYKTTGLGDLEKAAVGVTGINQALEIAQKAANAARVAFEQFGRGVKAVIDTGSQFEQYTIQFTTLLGSAEQAKLRMEELFRFASTTPFQLPDVVEAAQKLEAYGIYSERALRAAGDAAAAYGKQMNDAVEAVADAAMGEFERLKEFGIKAQHIQKQLGHELVRDTQEGLNEIRDAVIEIFEARTGGGMEALSKSLGGMISNLQDKWTAFKKVVADSGFFVDVKEIFGAILDTVNQLFETGKAQQLGKVIGESLADIMWDVTIALIRAGIALEKIAGFLAGPSGTLGKAITGEDVPWYLKGIQYGPIGLGRKIGEAFTGGGGGGESALETLLENVLLRREWAGRTPPPYRETPGGFGGGFYGAFGSWMPEGAPAVAAGAAPSLLAGEAAPRGTGGWTGEWRSIEFYDALEAKQSDTYEQMLDVEIEQARETMDTWLDAQDAILRGWDRMYSFSESLGERWRKGEKLRLKDLGKAYTEFGRGVLAAYIENKAKEWGLKATEETINAIAAVARYDFWAAAQHGAAAAGYIGLGATAGAVAGAIGSAGGGGGGGGGEAGVGAGIGADESAPGGTRHISRTTGISAQNITYNLYIIHNGTTVYGDAEEFFQGTILPQIQDAQALGVV